MDYSIAKLGVQTHSSPLLDRAGSHFVDPKARVLASADLDQVRSWMESADEPPAFEIAGPRRRLYFEPGKVRVGIVTCGGLCPGLNDVIRAIVMNHTYAYGVDQVLGFRYGYAGLAHPEETPALELDHTRVAGIHQLGGSILGASRGAQDVAVMVNQLVEQRIDILYTLGGDGTLRGARAIADEIARRELPIAVVGVPKTIDNDLQWVERSFGFATAVEEARRVIVGAHGEAVGAPCGVVIVKLMGRHSGFIAAHACLANNDANLCLVPEVPFPLDGPNGLYEAVAERVRRREHMVIVVAEGAGQEHVDATGVDKSGNKRLGNIGDFLRDRLKAEMATRGLGANVRYIDPSYILRSLPANAMDSEFCLQLGEHAVHAAMSGRTRMMVGYWNQSFTHVPLEAAIGDRRTLNPASSLWQSVLAATGQKFARVPVDD